MSTGKICMRALVALHLFCFAGSISLAQSAPHPIPFKPEAASGAGELLRVMGGLALCVLILAGVLYYLRRRAGLNAQGPGGATNATNATHAHRLRIVDRLRLGARSTLVVVEYEGMRHLLAQSEQGVVLITTFSGASAGGQGDVR
jgi:flagellar biogenesis protein FliO